MSILAAGTAVGLAGGLPLVPLATMSPVLMLASGLAGLNVLLLAALTTVWVRNYRTFRTPTVAGLAAFGGVLLIENVAAIYFYLSTRMLYSGDPLATRAVLALRALELVAVAFLTYVTMQ